MSEPVWLAFVCRVGMLLVREQDEARLPVVGVAFDPHNLSGETVPLGCAASDIRLSEPPLAVLINQSDVQALRAGVSAAGLATSYGPDGQDKGDNQDFALASRYQSDDDGDVIVGVVADGVTTKTFWPARSSRISCLVATQVLRLFFRSPTDNDDVQVDTVRTALARALKHALDADRRVLVEAGTIPNGWTADAYRSNIDRPDLWYNTTLLVGALASWGGLCVYAGDGGLILRRSTPNGHSRDHVLVRSGSSLDVSQFVSLAVSERTFDRATISKVNSGECIHLLLATDGVDRSIQQRFGADATTEAYFSLSLGSEAEALDELVAMSAWDTAERDNMSVVRISWPLTTRWQTNPQVEKGDNNEETGVHSTEVCIGSNNERTPHPKPGKNDPPPHSAILLNNRETRRRYSRLAPLVATHAIAGLLSAAVAIALMWQSEPTPQALSNRNPPIDYQITTRRYFGERVELADLLKQHNQLRNGETPKITSLDATGTVQFNTLPGPGPGPGPSLLEFTPMPIPDGSTRQKITALTATVALSRNNTHTRSVEVEVESERSPSDISVIEEGIKNLRAEEVRVKRIEASHEILQEKLRHTTDINIAQSDLIQDLRHSIAVASDREARARIDAKVTHGALTAAQDREAILRDKLNLLTGTYQQQPGGSDQPTLKALDTRVQTKPAVAQSPRTKPQPRNRTSAAPTGTR